VTVRPRRSYPLVLLALAAVLGWLGLRHADALMSGHPSNAAAVATAAFCWLVLMAVLAQAHRDTIVPATGATAAKLAALHVTVVVPLFNEDPAMFARMLDSLGAQTRLPARLIVVDDGSDTRDCQLVFETWHGARCPDGLEADFVRQDNGGKRHAQARAFEMDPAADIYVTVDSDVILDPGAIEYGLMPFTRRRTMSVAGFLVGANTTANLLTRLVDLGFVCSFLSGRAQYSRLGSVTVNAGGLAFYRGRVVRDNLEFYLGQTVAGRQVASGDDAMLTKFALKAGRTVFQRRALGYTLHPVTLRHLSKQRTRWWRSFWWGNAWFLRNFQARRIAWWMVTWDFITFAWMALILPAVLWRSCQDWHTAAGFAAVYVLLSYVGAVRYLSLVRTDLPRGSQWLTFALAPVASVLQLYLGWVLQWVGLCTFARTGWSTRAAVEVSLEAPVWAGASAGPQPLATAAEQPS